MKKLVMTLALCWTFDSCFALPLGNPMEPALFIQEIIQDDGSCCKCGDVLSFGLGFYGDYVFNRHLKTNAHHDVDNTAIYTNAGLLILNFYDKIDIFGTLGVSRFAFDTSFGAFNTPALPDPSPRFDFESGPTFSWSIGSRATLWQWRCMQLGIEGQYFRANAPLQRFSIASGAATYLDNLHAPYSEWQVGAGVASRMNVFIPYMGIKYAQAHFDLGNRTIAFPNNEALLHNLSAQKHWGFAFGLTYSPIDCDKIALTVEGRFGDEKACSVNGQIRF